MNEKQIRDAFVQIATDHEMDARIKTAVLSENEAKKSSQTEMQMHMRSARRSRSDFWKRTAAIAAAAVIALAGVSQIPQVQTFAGSIAEKFTTVFELDEEKVVVVSEFRQPGKKFKPDYKKFDTLAEAEEMMGIKLLKYDKGYERKNGWTFFPSETSEGEIYEVLLTNHYYVLGDLKNIKFSTSSDPAVGNTVYFTAGKKFRSPISCQMTIRVAADSAKDAAYPGYEEKRIDWLKEQNAEKYYCENLGIDIILYEIETDGPAAWDRVKTAKTASMKFIYKGIEYDFMGQVSLDTMKQIADNLHE